MARKKALKICRNLTNTITNMTPTIKAFRNEMFEAPRASKDKLVKKLKSLLKKYEIKKVEIK